MLEQEFQIIFMPCGGTLTFKVQCTFAFIPSLHNHLESIPTIFVWNGLFKLSLKHRTELSVIVNHIFHGVRKFIVAPCSIQNHKQEGGQEADFLSCAVFGKGAEFAEKYLHKGTKIAITGRLETGSYTNKDGVKVYTTTVIVEEQEFAESKASSQNNAGGNYQQSASNNSSSGDGFMNVPDGIDEELPFV